MKVFNLFFFWQNCAKTSDEGVQKYNYTCTHSIGNISFKCSFWLAGRCNLMNNTKHETLVIAEIQKLGTFFKKAGLFYGRVRR
jgi:hypothetical protein